METAFTLSRLDDLKKRLSAWSPMEKPRLSWSLLPEGIPQGAVVELSGSGKTTALAHFLQENPQKTAWLEKNFSLFPSALAQLHLSLEQFHFFHTKENSTWAATALLRSQLFPFLVYHAPHGGEKELRRFQLLSERSKTTFFLFSQKPSLAWPIALSLECRNGEIKVLKRK